MLATVIRLLICSGTGGRRRAGRAVRTVTVPCAARPLSGHAPPDRRQQALPQANSRQIKPKASRQSYRGSEHEPGRHPTSSQSYRDVEELLAERGIEVDHVTIYRWMQRFTPLLAEADRPCRHAVGDRWQVDETYVKVAGRWRYVYRAIDQLGQVIDVFVSSRRDATAARRFFQQAIDTTKRAPVEVITDKAAAYPAMLEELLPGAWHRTDRYANNHIEADHGRLKARLRPMRGLKQDRSARVVIAGHALVQNVRRGRYELAVEAPVNRRVAVAFDELALVI
jgi:IS6 family transposase